jgi:hypothetical protein
MGALAADGVTDDDAGHEMGLSVALLLRCGGVGGRPREVASGTAPASEKEDILEAIALQQKKYEFKDSDRNYRCTRCTGSYPFLIGGYILDVH